MVRWKGALFAKRILLDWIGESAMILVLFALNDMPLVEVDGGWAMFFQGFRFIATRTVIIEYARIPSFHPKRQFQHDWSRAMRKTKQGWNSETKTNPSFSIDPPHKMTCFIAMKKTLTKSYRASNNNKGTKTHTRNSRIDLKQTITNHLKINLIRKFNKKIAHLIGILEWMRSSTGTGGGRPEC